MFGRPFIVALDGKGVDPSQNAESWCKAFRKRWETDFLCACRFKNLADLTADDWKSYDVLLFSSAPEKTLPMIGSQDRFRPSLAGIDVRGKRIDGKALGLIAIWRNPTQPSHYIAVVTSNDFKHCSFPDANFAFAGWFDYLVWENDGNGSVRVRDSGQFDRSWH
jgi:hypothetical protein